MKSFAIGAVAGLLLGGGLVVVASTTGLVKVPTPETCILGFPNSDNAIVFELVGKGAWDVCDDQTNPIRRINALQGSSSLVVRSYAPRRLCQFDKYGLTWTIYAQGPLSADYPNPCNGGV